MNRTQYTAAVAKDMTERALQSQVEALLRETGWLFFHPADNRPNARGHVQRITAGYPDLHAIHQGRGREIYIELKRQSGRLSDEQKTWLHALEGLGHEVHVFRPADLLDGTILRALTGATATGRNRA